MIDANAIGEIIAIYEKHGWILRRVLLSAIVRKKLGDDGNSSEFGGVPLLNSEIDAAWFSRPPKTGGVAWEIRYLGDIPFALLENIDEHDPEFETTLSAVESRLKETIAGRESA